MISRFFQKKGIKIYAALPRTPRLCERVPDGEQMTVDAPAIIIEI